VIDAILKLYEETFSDLGIEGKAQIIDIIANDLSSKNLARLLGNALGVIGVDELVHNLREYTDSHYTEN
ncbi:hypothetical protein LCGC14_2100440, partial [marine sediment metagenome]